MVKKKKKKQKKTPANAGDIKDAWDMGSISGSGKFPGGGQGNTVQYSCLENPHGQRSLAGYSPQGHRESDTTEWLSRQAGIVSLLPTHFTVCVLSCFSHIQLFATLWTVAHQSPLFMGFSRQECWSELLCPPSKDLPHPGSSPGLSRLLHWQVGSLPLAPPGKPAFHVTLVLFYECFLVVMQVFRGSHCTRIVATYATMQ